MPYNVNISGRANLIKQLAETRDVAFWDFLKYIIYNETVYEIRITALKRANYFKKDENLENFFKELAQNKKAINEPFFSIALHYVNEKWSEELADKDIVKNILQACDSSTTELTSESYEIFEEISWGFENKKTLYAMKNKEYEKLHRFIKNSDTRIYNLQTKGVLNINEELTAFGINCLEKYAGLR
ncbi:MAG: hypothetical protein ACRYFX_16630 [Janthinobacterium lividum]